MDFRWTPEQEAFRSEFSAWLGKNYPTGYDPRRYKNYQSSKDNARDYREFQRRLSESGYAGMHYPKAYGGQGKTLTEYIIILQVIGGNCFELYYPGAMTHGLIVPTIFVHGTEDQKREFLPKIMNGTQLWCQGFSEPEAGSDVANVSTMAVRQGDHYVVNGQKVWATYAHESDYCILLVRTSRSGPKHRGLSYLLVDMKTPGVEVRPLRQLTGKADFCEIFLTDAKVPANMLVGQEGDGWKIAMTTLAFERTIGDVFAGALFEKSLQNLMQLARETKRSGVPVIQDPIFRQQCGQGYAEIMASKCLALRSLSQQLRGAMPGPEGSIGKLLVTETNQWVNDLAVTIQGIRGQIMSGSGSMHDGSWQFGFLKSRSETIAAGTSEVQRNIIGERVLGLPKEAARATER